MLGAQLPAGNVQQPLWSQLNVLLFRKRSEPQLLSLQLQSLHAYMLNQKTLHLLSSW